MTEASSSAAAAIGDRLKAIAERNARLKARLQETAAKQERVEEKTDSALNRWESSESNHDFDSLARSLDSLLEKSVSSTAGVSALLAGLRLRPGGLVRKPEPAPAQPDAASADDVGLWLEQARNLLAGQDELSAPLFDHFVVVGVPSTNPSVREMTRDTRNVRAQPEFLFVFPPQASERIVDVPSFCFPAGVKLGCVDRNDFDYNEFAFGRSRLSEADAHTFILTDGFGNSSYGVCVTVPSLVDADVRGDASGKWQVTGSRCVCVVSRHAVLPLLFRFVAGLVAMDRITRLRLANEGPAALAAYTSRSPLLRSAVSGGGQSRLQPTTSGPGPPAQSAAAAAKASVLSFFRGQFFTHHKELAEKSQRALDLGGVPARLRSSRGSLPTVRLGRSSSIRIDEDEDWDAHTEDSPRRGGSAGHAGDGLHTAGPAFVDPITIALETFQATAVPRRGESLTFRLSDDVPPVEFERPESGDGLTMARWALLRAARADGLPLAHLVTLLGAALLERQLVIVAPDLSLLSSVVVAVISLLRPFKWQCLVCPLLPVSMADFLEAPVPFVVGLPELDPRLLPRIHELVLWDYDRRSVHLPDAAGPHTDCPPLPRHAELEAVLRGPYGELCRGDEGEPLSPADRARAVDAVIGACEEHLEQHLLRPLAAGASWATPAERSFAELFAQTQMYSALREGQNPLPLAGLPAGPAPSGPASNIRKSLSVF
eukprot:tig00000821_g4512.t1